MANTPSSPRITEGVIWKTLLSFFFPILLGSFFQQMYNTVDTIIVGRAVGTQALAAVGSTGPLLNLINGFFIGLSSGATVILSQQFGANDRSGVSKALHTGMTLSVILGVFASLIGTAAGPMLLRMMKTPESCLADASTYIQVYFAGALASMIYNMGSGILRAMGDSKRPMYYLIVACLVNIVADLVLVVWLKLGVIGAALATVVSMTVSAILVIAALLRQPEQLRLHISKLCIDAPLLRRILIIGIPAGLQFITFDLANVLIQSGINSFGEITVAAWTAFGKADALVWMVSGAFGVSITTFVGQNFGAQKYKRVRQSVRVCMVMSIVLVGAMSAVELVFRHFILGIYTPDPEVIRVGAYAMLWIVPFNFLFMPVEVYAGAMRGTGYSVMPTVITCVFVCVFRVVWVMTVVSRWHTLENLCIIYPLSWLVASAVFAMEYRRGTWLHKRIEQCGMEPEGQT